VEGMSVKGYVFIALMFLGLGVGMVIGQPGPGIVIGMGIGFIALALLPGEGKREEVEMKIHSEMHGTIGALILTAIGIGFVIGGLGMAGIVNLNEQVWRSLGAAVLIALGAAFLYAAITQLLKARK